MPKLAANLTMLFNEVDFLDRFAAAERAGFRAVEYLFPYAYEKEQLADLLGRHRLQQALHNLPAGDWAKGERGIACHPDRRGEFGDGVGQAIEYARALGCSRLNCLAGIAPPGVEQALLERTFIDNLKLAADATAEAGIQLLTEAINTRDIPGFFLNRTQQARAVLEAVGSPNLYLQYDIYHMQIMEGDLAPTIERNFARIGHFQIADNPGRGEPGTGEINHVFLFALLDRLGYTGFVGAEYKPRGKTDEGLGWARPWL